MDVLFYQTKPDVCNGPKPLECKVILIIWNLATASKQSWRTYQMQGHGNNLDCFIARTVNFTSLSYCKGNLLDAKWSVFCL
jgi:hypothetical protein